MPKLYYFEKCKEYGLNSIIARIEISAEDSVRTESVGVDILSHLLESSKKAKQVGLHFFFTVDIAGNKTILNQGLKGTPYRHNNDKTPSILDEKYWQRVIESRFLRAAKLLKGDEFQFFNVFLSSLPIILPA